MRSRFLIFAPVAIVLTAVLVAGCGARGFGPSIPPTPVPTKTLRPTFTHTPAQPTAVPPTATPEVPPTATPEPPTPTPEVPPTDTPEPATPTPEAATLRVTSATVNVRSGPSTSFGRVGRASAGDTFEVTGKNPAGDWWEIDFNGRTAWVYSQMASVTRPEVVEVAANLPQPPPTVRPVAVAPRPTAAPAQPTAPPAPATRFGVMISEARQNTNPGRYSIFCRALSRDGTKFVPGAIRVTLNGNVVAEKSFPGVEARGNPGLASEFIYSMDCKLEIPEQPGTYTAFLIEGGNPISDPINFTAGGETRDFIIGWREK